MTVLNPAQLAELRAALSQPPYQGLSASAAYELLYTPAPITNPDPAPTGPVPFTATEVLGLVSSESAAKVAVYPHLLDVRNKIVSNDVPGTVLWASLLAAGGLIAPTEAQAIATLVSRTGPDPSWPATVPGPTPASQLFPGVVWNRPDGTVATQFTEDDVVLAMRS